MAEASRSQIMAKLKQKSKGAFKRARTVKPEARGQSLPPGINNGVAKLSSWKMALTKDGDPYFMITGLVVEPAEHEGRRASVMHFINESEYATVEQNLERLCSDLALMGMEGVEELEEDDLPDAIEEFVKGETHFFFNTRKRKNGDTIIYVQGPAPDFDKQSSNGKSASGKPSGRKAQEPEPEPDVPTPDLDVGVRVEVDYDGTMYPGEVTAIDGDTVSISFDDGTEADHDASEVFVLPVDPTDDFLPEKGQVFGYKVGRKIKAVEITKVKTKDKTVNLVDTEDADTTYEDIPWDDLLDAPE